MKKEYNAPELEMISFVLSRDILGDSKVEQTDAPDIGGGAPGEFGGFD